MAETPNVPARAPQQSAEAAKSAEEARRKQVEAARGDEDKRRKRQDENNKKAAEVMEKSTPWPSQELADRMKLGIADPDEQPPEQPEMPSLEEQRRADKDEAKRR